MNFLKYELGTCQGGEIIEIALTSGANVRLMTSSEFSNYRNGRRHQFIGGLAKRSPVRLQIPHSGMWYVVVDMQGLRGSTRASVRKVPGMLPEIREAPLSSVPSLVHEPAPAVEPGVETYDVFISHASEDKETVVRALARALIAEGLKVWYDEFALRIGDSLRQKIDKGLARSRVGLVVLSPAFVCKGWTNYELDGIVTRAVSAQQEYDVRHPLKLLIIALVIVFGSPSAGEQTPARTRGGPALDLRCLSAEHSSCGCSLKIVGLACQASHSTGWMAHFASELHQGAPLRLNLGGRDISLRSRRSVTNSFRYGEGDSWIEEYEGENMKAVIRYRPAKSTCHAAKEDGCEYFDVAAEVVIRVESGSRTYEATGACGC